MLAAEAQSTLTGLFDGLTGFSRVAVAVSGGSDSMALLRLVLDWRGSGLGPRDVFALTVDHGLRAESADEALMVAQWCAALGVQHAVLVWAGQKPGTGIQAKAREARYDILTHWCRQQRVPVLLTGHTADDQAETVAMRQQRTMSDRSLAGIWPENEWRGVKLMRPVLGVRRESLRSYLKDIGQGWIEDPSNANRLFERVRVREEMDAAATPLLAQMAAAAQARVTRADETVREWLRANIVVDAYGVVRISRTLLGLEPLSLRAGVLRWAIMAASGGEAPEPRHVDALQQWLDQGGASRRSAGGAIVSARTSVIEVMREPGRMRQRFTDMPESGEMVFDNRFLVSAPQGSQIGAAGIQTGLKRPKAAPAFAFAALPAVKLPDGRVYLATNGHEAGISATLCERFNP